MDKEKVINGLNEFKRRLMCDVKKAYEERGRNFGMERFETWRHLFKKFLDANLPGQSVRFEEKLTGFRPLIAIPRQTDAEYFWNTTGEALVSYDSLILDIKNDEYCLPESPVNGIDATLGDNSENVNPRKIFVVHGHDNETKERIARFLEKLGLEPIILNEQASRGLTICDVDLNKLT